MYGVHAGVCCLYVHVNMVGPGWAAIASSFVPSPHSFEVLYHQILEDDGRPPDFNTDTLIVTELKNCIYDIIYWVRHCYTVLYNVCILLLSTCYTLQYNIAYWDAIHRCV